MTAAEREEFCEKHKLDVVYFLPTETWAVLDGEASYETLSEAPYRDVAIDLAADRLAERGLL